MPENKKMIVFTNSSFLIDFRFIVVKLTQSLNFVAPQNYKDYPKKVFFI
jgi:hypothetical protein